MKLTGKCKVSFEKWYMKNLDIKIGNLEILKGKTVKFYRLPESMQYGVYVDFFDSVKIYIITTTDSFGCFGYEIDHEKGIDGIGEWQDTRREAQVKAIQKAKEIFNNK